MDQDTARRKLGSSGWNYSAEFTWCHRMPSWMMIVTMMTSRPATLDRATVITVCHVLAAFYLVRDRVA